jgi:hypothetical protein
MTTSSYLNLFLDSDITWEPDKEKYGRCLDALLAQEPIALEDIVGIGERSDDLIVVHRQAVYSVEERGLFKKRIEIQRLCPIASIARIRGTQEGFKGLDLALTAHDAKGEVLFRLVWGLQGTTEVTESIPIGQRDRVFKLISDAMDRLSAPARPSVASAPSKAQALREWAADVVEASGAGVTPALVEEHANMVAGTIRIFTLLPLAGTDDLANLLPAEELDATTPIESFDAVYQSVVARVGNAGPVDQAIDAYLAEAWTDYVRGCHEAHASP